MRLLLVNRYKKIIILLVIIVFSPFNKTNKKVELFSERANYQSKYYCLVDGLILVNNSDFHLLSDKYSKEFNQKRGEEFIHFHDIEPTFSDKLVGIHEITFFVGLVENRMAVIINAAVLWQAKQDYMIGKIGSNPASFKGSKELLDFAEIIYKPLVDYKINHPSIYIKYDQSLILKRKIQKNTAYHVILIRKFQRYFDSVNSAPLLRSSVKQSLCTFTTSQKLKMRLKKYLKNVTQITGDMGFQEQAHLFSMCDILVTENTMDIAIAFVLKPKITIIGLNIDKEWMEEMGNLWNIRVLSQKLDLSSPKSFEAVTSVLDVIQTTAKNKFLMFMPWEQLNNQIIGFKAACAMAKVLDRILVLPYLGYRTKKEWNFSFNHKDYSWAPMENYFDLVDLPCRVISLSNFKTLHGKRINDVHFNPVAKATSYQQITDYYKEILGLHFTSIRNHSKMSQLSEDSVLEMFHEDISKVLSFGSLFWAFGFGKTQDYPLKKYITYMDNDLYKQISKGIIINRRIVSFCKKSIRNRIGARPLVSVHIRRGDYWNKCKAITDLTLQAHCYPSLTDIKQKIRDVLESIRGKSGDNIYKSAWDQDVQYVYISTNLLKNRSELNDLQKQFNILFFEDIYDMQDIKRHNFDPIDIALMDRQLDTSSDIFIGNFYSSFSRTIFEARELLNRPFETF